MLYQIEFMFHLPRDSALHDVAHALEFLRPFTGWLGKRDATLGHWFLGGNNLEEGLRYEAFAEGSNGHDATLAVLKNEYKGSREPSIFLWNGRDDSQGANLVLRVSDKVFASTFKLSLGGPRTNARIGSWKDVAEFVGMVATETRPVVAKVHDQPSYFKRQIYKDRPGVGWMIYLPLSLSGREVPEARAVIPVERDKERLGTILVSVTDAPVFDDLVPEHVEASHAIETRLVSNDWLPTFRELLRPAGA